MTRILAIIFNIISLRLAFDPIRELDLCDQFEHIFNSHIDCKTILFYSPNDQNDN